jgi:hypothetical protein
VLPGVRHLVEGVGFEDVVADGVTVTWRGGETGARFLELTWSVLHKSGLINENTSDSYD